MMNPMKTKLNAKVRILLILLEYFFAISIPLLKKYYTIIRMERGTGMTFVEK